MGAEICQVQILPQTPYLAFKKTNPFPPQADDSDNNLFCYKIMQGKSSNIQRGFTCYNILFCGFLMVDSGTETNPG